MAQNRPHASAKRSNTATSVRPWWAAGRGTKKPGSLLGEPGFHPNPKWRFRERLAQGIKMTGRQAGGEMSGERMLIVDASGGGFGGLGAGLLRLAPVISARRARADVTKLSQNAGYGRTTCEGGGRISRGWRCASRPLSMGRQGVAGLKRKRRHRRGGRECFRTADLRRQSDRQTAGTSAGAVVQSSW